MVAGRVRRRGAARAGALALVLAASAGCTAQTVDPERAATVVVAVDAPFESLNAGAPEGRAPGSTLVRGLVSDGFVGLDEAGGAVFDTAFGTVEKVSDEPLTVRYTLSEQARWSDGVPVTPADLLLEWAARSGQLDEVVAGRPAAGGTATDPAASGGDAAAGGPGSAEAAAGKAGSGEAAAGKAGSGEAAAGGPASAAAAAGGPGSAAAAAGGAASGEGAVVPVAPRPDPTQPPETPVATLTSPPPSSSPVEPSAGPSGSPTSPTPDEPTSPGPTTVPPGSVDFGSPSAALAVASAMPTIEGRSVTLVYDHPVPDWQVALDVGLPAHVVGRLALADDPAGGAAPAGATPTGGVSTGGAPTGEVPTGEVPADASPSGEVSTGGAPTGEVPPGEASTSGASTSGAATSGASTAGASTAGAPTSASPTDAGAAWADEVARAITGGDRAALVRISEAWRTGFGAEAIAADLARAVTTGPYRIASLDAARNVELVPNPAYAGARPADRARIVVRWDLSPLDAVEALRVGDVDVAAPISTPDVTTALTRVPEALVHTGGGPVFQLVLNESAGPFAMALPSQAPSVATLRATFVAAVPRDQIAREAGGPPSSAVLATLGAGAVTDPPVATGGAGEITEPVTVRVLAAAGDPVRTAMLDELTAAASAAGFAVTAAQPSDPETALWDEPDSWDAALVPVPQAELPVAATVDRWRTGSATNVSGHADEGLDAVLKSLAATADPAAVAAALAQVGGALRDTRVVVPLVRQPSVVATVERPPGSPLPRVGDLPVVPWGDADLSAWWSWATRTPT